MHSDTAALPGKPSWVKTLLLSHNVCVRQPQMCVFIIPMCKSQKENLVFQVFGKAKCLFSIVRIIFSPCKALK